MVLHVRPRKKNHVILIPRNFYHSKISAYTVCVLDIQDMAYCQYNNYNHVLNDMLINKISVHGQVLHPSNVGVIVD